MNRGGTLPRRPPNPRAKNVGPGHVASSSGWQVSAAPGEHVQPWLDSLAYRVDTPDGSVVFTGDTQPCKSVIDLARDADMMLCMCWDDQETMRRSGEDVGQCGTTGAAEMAQEAGRQKAGLGSHRARTSLPDAVSECQFRDGAHLPGRDHLLRRTHADRSVASQR